MDTAKEEHNDDTTPQCGHCVIVPAHGSVSQEDALAVSTAADLRGRFQGALAVPRFLAVLSCCLLLAACSSGTSPTPSTPTKKMTATATTRATLAPAMTAARVQRLTTDLTHPNRNTVQDAMVIPTNQDVTPKVLANLTKVMHGITFQQSTFKPMTSQIATMGATTSAGRWVVTLSFVSGAWKILETMPSK